MSKAEICAGKFTADENSVIEMPPEETERIEVTYQRDDRDIVIQTSFLDAFFIVFIRHMYGTDISSQDLETIQEEYNKFNLFLSEKEQRENKQIDLKNLKELIIEYKNENKIDKQDAR